MSLLEAVKKHRIIVAVRGIPEEAIVDTAAALCDGGIRMLEITFDQSDPDRCEKTPRMIRMVREALGDRLLIGAGTVLSTAEAEAACGAGAGYILSPNLNLSVVRRTKELGLGSVPGAMTPSEIAAAYECGADVVKIFPCDALGISYLRAVRTPLSQVPMIAMGGVNIRNFKDYLKVVEAVGIGSAIADRQLAARGDFKGLEELARSFTAQLEDRELHA